MEDDADDFNEGAIEHRMIRASHVSELTARFQAAQGLKVDGKCGPKTRALLELLRGREVGDVPAAPGVVAGGDLSIDAGGWLVGPGVVRIPIHASRFYARLSTSDGRPRAIVAHYTATDHGTAAAMFRRLTTPLDTDPDDGDGVDRQVSWHVSLEGDGAIYQGASFLRGCWHAGGASAKPIAGVGPANRTAVGIELVGHGDAFPEAQVGAAERVWRAIVQRYGIKREYAMVGHSDIDPGRKRDPGPVWESRFAGRVVDYAFR